MTIQQVKAEVTQRDIESKSVYVQTTLTPNPLRLIRVGRELLTVLNNNGDVRRIYPDIVTEIRM